MSYASYTYLYTKNQVVLRNQDFVPGNVIVERIMTRYCVGNEIDGSSIYDWRYENAAKFMIISCVKRFTRRHNKHKVDTQNWEVFVMPLGTKDTTPVKMTFLYGRRSDLVFTFPNRDYQRVNIYGSKK
jgi:hypothetical protein